MNPDESTETTATDAPPWGDRTPESLWDENKNLRKENEDKRKRYSKYEPAFDGLSEDTANVLLDFARAVRSGDETSIKGYVSTWADSFGISKAEVKEAIADATEEKGRPLTAADLDKLRQELREESRRELTQAEQQRATRDLADTIITKAKSLGYDQGEDPFAWKGLLGRATEIQHAEGIEALAALEKAHAERGERDQRIIDSFVASKGQEAQRRPAPSSSGSAPTKDTTPKNIAEATERMKARF